MNRFPHLLQKSRTSTLPRSGGLVVRQRRHPALGRTVLATTAVALTLSLGACMNLSGLDGSSQYGCQAPAGVQCESVSGTYYNSLKNNLPSQRAHAGPQNSPSGFTPVMRGSVPRAMASGAGATSDPSDPPPDPITPHTEPMSAPVPLRSPGKVLGMWFKPWKDADGDLFDEGHVYVQVDSGDWLIDHVQQRIREAYAPVRAPGATRSAAQGAVRPATSSAMGARPPAPALAPGHSITDAARALQAGQAESGELGDQ